MGSAAVIETSTGPGRPVPMLIGGDDFPFPDSRPEAGREVQGMGEIPGPAESGPSALDAIACCE